jgi:hypothetical protein
MPVRYNNTSFGSSNPHFQTTEWTKILSTPVGESILSELYMKYWKPVYSYLRRKGFNNDQAKDIIQGFFTEKVLGQQLLLKADRTKGKFRTFLLTAIKNYTIDLHRANRPMQELDDRADKSADIGNPELEFDLVWAKKLLQSVLEELEAECRSRDKMTHWDIFRTWFLEPNVDSEKVDMSAICDKYDIDDVSTAYNMISNLKKRFRNILRHRFSCYIDSDTEIDNEINYFINIFSKSTTR